MTILSCSAVIGGNSDGVVALIGLSHVPIPPQFLERLLTLLILRTARPLRHSGAAQFLDDLVHCGSPRLDRERARVTPDAPVTFPLLIRQIEWYDRNLLPLDVLPDV